VRAFALFLTLMTIALLSIAALAYPAWLLLHPHFGFPFHRIGERVGLITLIIGFVALARWANLWDTKSLGYGTSRRRFRQELLIGLALGVATMALIVGVMAALGLLSWRPGQDLDAFHVGKIVANRFLSGLAVGFLEETLLRGAMFTAIQRESGTRVAVVLTALVYSATHFLASYHIPAEQVTAGSGLALLAGTLHLFEHPMQIADAFLCLLAVGIVLADIRAITGNIAACIGLHAGWVWVMLASHELSQPDRQHPLSFLLSSFDGFVGWLVLAWTVVLGVTFHRLYLRRARALGARAAA
jgi:membrane protease YdiL (CAAX protease family)